MSTELTLRLAEPSDSDAMAALYGAARRAAVPAMPPSVHTAGEDRARFSDQLADQLADREHEAWLAEQDRSLVGFALVTATWLDALYVRPGSQREGVGGALLEVVKAVRPGGFGLWVFESNEPARAFYRRHGLVEREHTDGSGNEEGQPDLRMVWPAAGRVVQEPPRSRV